MSTWLTVPEPLSGMSQALPVSCSLYRSPRTLSVHSLGLLFFIFGVDQFFMDRYMETFIRLFFFC